MSKKRETIDEFLTRGGEIRKFGQAEQEEKEEITVRNTSHAPPTIYNLSEGEFFFGKKKNTKKKNNKLPIDEVKAKLKEITGE